MKTNSNLPSFATSSPWARLWVYFGFAFGWSWFFWLLAVGLGASMQTALGITLGLLGLLGPMLAGITSTYLTHGKEGRRDYWLRLIDVKRIGAQWYLVMFLLTPMIFAVAVVLDGLAGGSGTAWEEPALRILAAPWTIVPFALSIFLVGPMEEFGWRGYVLDRLQEKWNAPVSSLILGIMWSLWHLPLFFIKDSYQYNLGAGSPSFWLFMFGIVPLTFVFTWLFNNTQRSTLAAMLFHFMVNFTGELVALSPRAEFYSILLWSVVAIVVTTIWGARSRMHRGSGIAPTYPQRFAR